MGPARRTWWAPWGPPWTPWSHWGAGAPACGMSTLRVPLPVPTLVLPYPPDLWSRRYRDYFDFVPRRPVPMVCSQSVFALINPPFGNGGYGETPDEYEVMLFGVGQFSGRRSAPLWGHHA